MKRWFGHRALVIATQHGKERVIQPCAEESLAVRCCLPGNLNTDRWGTFSGEVPRLGHPLAAARLKCEAAMALTGTDLAIASEGSFGPHPSIPFVPVDEEWLLLVDARNGWEIAVRHLSGKTNFAGTEIRTEPALWTFAEKAGFPDHGLVLRDRKNGTASIRKGIVDREELRWAFGEMLAQHGQAFVETDMRALYNPSRMAVIGEAMQRLVEKALCNCPVCEAPGYGVVEQVPGLPCGLCGTPTSGAMAEIWACGPCGYRVERPLASGTPFQDPMWCDVCNP